MNNVSQKFKFFVLNLWRHTLIHPSKAKFWSISTKRRISVYFLMKGFIDWAYRWFPYCLSFPKWGDQWLGVLLEWFKQPLNFWNLKVKISNCLCDILLSWYFLGSHKLITHNLARHLNDTVSPKSIWPSNSSQLRSVRDCKHRKLLFYEMCTRLYALLNYRFANWRDICRVRQH